jgi:phytoene synthase
VELGLALQMTNILRDVAPDLASGRIYLPKEDMARFGYSGADLAAQIYDRRFVRLMQFEAERARQYFRRAAAILPREDRRAMIGAEIMGSIYRALLEKMEGDRYRVFVRNYRLSKPAKFLHAARQLLKVA